ICRLANSHCCVLFWIVRASSCHARNWKKSCTAGKTASTATPLKCTSTPCARSWAATSSKTCAALAIWFLNKFNNSIRRQLLLWLALGLSGGILLAGIVLYFQARDEANDIFDYQMRQIAASLPRQAFAPIAPGQNLPGLDDEIMMQIWDSTGTVIYHSHSRSVMPQQAELGFIDVPGPGGMWRVYSAQIGSTVVQVSQPQSARKEVAAQMAVKTVMPLLLLFPFLGALIWVAVGHGLAPVRRAAADVQLRDMNTLTPIADQSLPQEIRPLTQAFNDLLERLH